jgi:ribosomal protein S18 acetylase RimI-like enzyme
MEIKRLTNEEFWPLFHNYRPQLFNDSFHYAPFDVQTEYEKEQSVQLRANLKDKINIHLVAFNDENELIGWSSSFQKSAHELYMMNSAIFPEYRRTGLYSRLVHDVLELAEEYGFQTVTSNHVTTNNAVIIAKLKLGFCISGIELTDDFGTLVKLTKHLNETRDKISRFRSGEIKPDKEIKSIFKL